ncbi:MAG: GNAT family N-acetyltransferase [Phycisphaerales bacterium]|nr:GNAT family N-acetyltransferase [Phycisphaerales bacterium]
MSDLIAIPRQNETASSPVASYCISDFDALYAPLIASWVRSEEELTWLAPGTAPPLSASKVIAWGNNVGYRFLFWSTDPTSDRQGLDGPIGYAELNRMPKRSNQMWIGHFVLDPDCRGRGHGQRFVQALLRHAFQVLTASDVLLVVFPENKTAIRCYEKCGMIITGRERKYFKNTHCTHHFYRMEAKRHQFEETTMARGTQGRGIPFVRDTAQLRSGTVSRRRALNQS